MRWILQFEIKTVVGNAEAFVAILEDCEPIANCINAVPWGNPHLGGYFDSATEKQLKSRKVISFVK